MKRERPLAIMANVIKHLQMKNKNINKYKKEKKKRDGWSLTNRRKKVKFFPGTFFSS